MDRNNDTVNRVPSHKGGAPNQPGPPIVRRGHSTLKVKYSMVNYDFSMHESMSGDYFSGGDGDGASGDGGGSGEHDNEHEDDDEAGGGGRGVVGVDLVDEVAENDGAKQQQHVVHQSQQPNANARSSNEKQQQQQQQQPAEKNSGATEDDHNMHKNAMPNHMVPAVGLADGKGMGVRHPVAQRPRGVDLSSSSSEEYDDDNGDNDPNNNDRDHDHHAPGMRGSMVGKQQSSGGHMKQPGECDDDIVIVDDSQYDEMEVAERRNEEGGAKGKGKPDRYENQFMRIPVPASELKDVASVERDLDHDKPKLGRRGSFIQGLQRAMSGVRLSGELERPRLTTTAHEKKRKVTAGMQRTTSRKGGLYRKGGVIGPVDAAGMGEKKTSTGVGGDKVTNKNGTNPVKRQAIGDLGRMISMNRQRAAAAAAAAAATAAAATSAGTTGATVAAAPTVTINAPPSKGVNKDPVSNNSLSQISLSQESVQLRNRKDANGQDNNNNAAGTAAPKSERSTNSLKDRPRNSDRVSGGAPIGRQSIGQMTRMISRGQRKSMAYLDGGSSQGLQSNTQPTGERTGARSSLSRIGRALSFNRGKTTLQQQKQQQQLQLQQQGDVQPQQVSTDQKQISPMSTSTVSATSVTSSPMADRERTQAPDAAPGMAPSAGANPVRQGRLSLRNATRMFSFTRKSVGAGALEGGGRNGEQRNSGAVGNRQSRHLSRGKSNANMHKHSGTEVNVGGGGVGVGVGGGVGGGGGTGGSKVEGRADKFVYSEVTSAAIIQSGLIGNGKHIRVAQIAMAEYSFPLSRDKWYVDIFTLGHNAVRRECIDLYDMLSASARCDASERDICDDDINALERWWLVAHSLLRSYFDMERGILFPWVDSAGSQEWEVQLALKKMRSLKDKLETLLSKVDRVWNEKTFKSSGEMFAMFYKAVDDFVPRLMNYFSDQEMLLPAIVKEFYKREHAVEIDKQIVAAFMNPPDDKPHTSMDTSKYNLVSLVRWIPKSKQMRAWLGKYLSGSERSLYPTWYQMYEENHASIVTQLRGRAATI